MAANLNGIIIKRRVFAFVFQFSCISFRCNILLLSFDIKTEKCQQGIELYGVCIANLEAFKTKIRKTNDDSYEILTLKIYIQVLLILD